MTQPAPVSAQELAHWLGLEKLWLEQLADAGELPAVHDRRGYAFDPRCLHDWVQSRRPNREAVLPVDVSALREVSLALAGGERPESVSQRILDRVLEVLGAEIGAIFIAEDDGWLRAVARTGLRGGRMQSKVEDIARWVASNAAPLLLADPRRAEDVPTATDPDDPRDAIVVPFLLEDRVLGVLAALGRREAPRFTDWHLSLATVLATELALAIERTRIQETLGYRLSGAQRQLEAYAVDVRRSFSAEKMRTQELLQAYAELETTYYATVRGISAAVEAKDAYTAGHLARVSRYGLEMIRLLAPAQASDPKLQYGFLLHDVGKLGVPDSILTKPGPLTESEWALMRQHPEIGLRIIDGIPFLEQAKEIVFSHHERWDGKGYPQGLKGEDIPLGARVFAVADAFDAMTTDRPYRPALSIDEALTEIRAESSSQFWPEAVDAFLSLPRKTLEDTVTFGRPPSSLAMSLLLPSKTGAEDERTAEGTC